MKVASISGTIFLRYQIPKNMEDKKRFRTHRCAFCSIKLVCPLLISDSAVNDYGIPLCDCIWTLFRSQESGLHDHFFFCTQEHLEKEAENRPSD